MSDFFVWDAATFGLHVPKMDDEHQAIIACMNKLHVLYEAKASVRELSKAVNELTDVTVKHFADEEAYMATIGYPDLNKHKMMHKSLLGKVIENKTRFEATGKLQDEFFSFLKFWLKSHICGIDTKYATHKKAS